MKLTIIYQLLINFFNLNGIDTSKYNVYDFDKKNLPTDSYDLIISLYSLDYHYDFNIYTKYLRSVSNLNTKIIFDTIRPDFFTMFLKKYQL